MALEGGGVRSLSALMTLQQLMETVNLDARLKLSEYFYIIGGTRAVGRI